MLPTPLLPARTVPVWRAAPRLAAARVLSLSSRMPATVRRLLALLLAGAALWLLAIALAAISLEWLVSYWNQQDPSSIELAQTDIVALLAVCMTFVVATAAGLRWFLDRRRESVELEKAFIGDVYAILRLMTCTRLPHNFMMLHEHPEKDFPWADTPRDGDYFAVFKANASKLGLLHETGLSRSLAEFYTSLAGSRDAAAALRKIRPSEPAADGTPCLRQYVSMGVLCLLLSIYEAGLQIVRLKGGVTEEDVRDDTQMRIRIQAFLRSGGDGTSAVAPGFSSQRVGSQEQVLYGPDNKALHRNNLIDLLSEEMDPRKTLRQLRWETMAEGCC